MPLAVAALLCAAARTEAGQAGGPGVRRTVSLAGEWRFLLDPRDTGLRDRIWTTTLPDRIRLPGSTDEARAGVPNTRPATLQRLSRLVEYAGPAWYQRSITLPYEWRRRRITLFLERCHWETRVWLDNHEIGSCDSLSTPHVYDLTPYASPGVHRLTIRVDNRTKYSIGPWTSAISEESQTNWNGIIGRIELRATARVWIEELRAYPDLLSRTAKVRVRVGNITGRRVSVTLTHTFRRDGDTVGPSEGFRAQSADCPPGFTSLEQTVRVPPEAGTWDEFSPRTLELGTGLRATDGSTTWLHGAYAPIGMRSIGHDETHLTLNGRRVFLRGTVERCVFPLTGYPPMTVEAWASIFATARSYGLNHMRFHTWCPPEAAFIAADRAGFLLQIEAPLWVGDVGQNAPRDRFIRDEMVRILDTFGNHPSFALFCIGNELAGDATVLQEMVRIGRSHDPRHLYASSTALPSGAADDFCVASIRGVPGPATDHDPRTTTASRGIPMIAHEVGQWAMFPDILEMGRYTGVLRADGLVKVQTSLEAAGLLPRARALVHTTGRAALELYKEEIERHTRNPNGAGYQLLGITDFPGHGMATVGWLSAFWDTKGLVEPEEVRRFCGPTVPLLRLASRVYETSDELTGRIEIAHYGPRDLDGAVVTWSVSSAAGTSIAAGELAAASIPTGRLTAVGSLSCSLRDVAAPERLTITVGIRDSAIRNSWRVWVYPAEEAPATASGVLIADAVTEPVLQALRDGKRVVLMDGARAARRSIQGSPTPVFWSPISYAYGPGTMGILCDPYHPALRRFPTDAWTDWQWWDILERSRSMVIGDGQPALEPVIRILDNFVRNLPLALVAQCTVGSGRLLVVGADLQSDLSARPAARQLRRSLMAYAASDDFAPSATLTEAELLALYPHSERDAIRSRQMHLGSEIVLHVRAGTAADPGKAAVQSPATDAILVRSAGYDYKVEGAHKDQEGAGWRTSSDMRVTIRLPRGFAGTLQARVHHWQGTAGAVQMEYEGRFIETLTRCGPDGLWLRIPVSATDTADGEISVVARPESGIAAVSEIAISRAADAPDGR